MGAEQRLRQALHPGLATEQGARQRLLRQLRVGEEGARRGDVERAQVGAAEGHHGRIGYRQYDFAIKPATEEKDGVVYNTKESCDAWRKEISACFGPSFGYRDPHITPPPGQDNYVDFEEKLSEPDQRKIAALKEAAIGCVNRYFETCK